MIASEKCSLRKKQLGIFWDDGNVLYLDGARVTWLYAFVKTLQVVHLRFVHYIVCKVYLNNRTINKC